MKRFYKKHHLILEILLIISLWRIYLFIVQTFAFFYSARVGYLGFVPESNFDGVFYVNISQYWYRGLDQAFFPFYPMVMKIVAFSFSIPPAASGIIVSVFSLIILLLFFKKLMLLDRLKKSVNWSLLFLLFFPTAFFLSSVYTESLFILFVILSFYFMRKKNIYMSVIFGIFATATRIIGVFLLPALLLELYFQMKTDGKNNSITFFMKKSWILFFIPTGLISYMVFLGYKYADPLLFIHIQPAFGAGRSGGEIIMLPQVIYRYVKILTTVSYSTQVFFVSLLEIIIFLLSAVILFFGFKKGVRKSYILFSAFALFFPTLSGTLSSMPRYVLVCFAVFMSLGLIESKILKIFLLLISIMIQSVLAILFYRGYFIA